MIFFGEWKVREVRFLQEIQPESSKQTNKSVQIQSYLSPFKTFVTMSTSMDMKHYKLWTLAALTFDTKVQLSGV